MTRRRQWRRRPRGRPLAVALLAAAVLAAPALAKEDVQATLTSPVPLDAAPGQEIRVAWRLESIDDEGRRHPFGASGVIVQLESASGGEPTVGFATGDGGRNGSFEAIVVVPEGGIEGIAIGLGGTVSDPTGTRAGYVYFPVTNSPLPAVTNPTPLEATPEPTPPPAEPAESLSGGSWAWIAALALAGLAGLAAVMVFILRRRRPAAA
jgi:hypothetical protein